MKKYILFLSILSILFWSCGDDDNNLTPSGLEKDWLVLEDSEDPIDHLRYEVFRDFGVPIYYNDTIGSQIRYTEANNIAYTYYEILQVFYRPGNKTPINGKYTLLPDRNYVTPVIEFLRDEVLPLIPEKAYLPSILLADTLQNPNGDTLIYQGFNTYVIGSVKTFDTWNKEENRDKIVATILYSVLTLNESEWLEDNFYRYTYETNLGNMDNIYSDEQNQRIVYQACNGITVKHSNFQTLGLLGLLGDKTTGRTAKTPTKERDVQQYCIAILTLSENEFMETYARRTVTYTQTVNGKVQSFTEEVEYPAVKEKYYAMKEKLQEYGFEFED